MRIPEGEFDVRDYVRLPTADREQFDAWLEATTGIKVIDLHTPRIELHGEGHLIVHRYDYDEMKVRSTGEPVVYAQAFQAATPPPVWHDRSPHLSRSEAILGLENECSPRLFAQTGERDPNPWRLE